MLAFCVLLVAARAASFRPASGVPPTFVPFRLLSCDFADETALLTPDASAVILMLISCVATVQRSPPFHLFCKFHEPFPLGWSHSLAEGIRDQAFRHDWMFWRFEAGIDDWGCHEGRREGPAVLHALPVPLEPLFRFPRCHPRNLIAGKPQFTIQDRQKHVQIVVERRYSVAFACFTFFSSPAGAPSLSTRPRFLRMLLRPRAPRMPDTATSAIKRLTASAKPFSDSSMY